MDLKELVDYCQSHEPTHENIEQLRRKFSEEKESEEKESEVDE